ncbi:MAG TPA: hypothetical protein VGM88_10435 [Kofleriaceae bacterium]|jgi:hypothetical protein
MKKILLVLAAATSPAFADPSFEQQAQSAQRVKHAEDVVWALGAKCDEGDDVQQRECRHVRDARAQAYAGATLLVEGDGAGVTVSKFDPKKKSVEIRVDATIASGDKWKVVAAGGKPIYDNGRPFADGGAADTWTRAVDTARSGRPFRLQVLAKVPAKASGKELALDVIGFRVFAPCDGAVIAASPPSATVDVPKDTCKKK